MYILWISAFYHDSAACLIKDDDIIAWAQEERFTRIKQDSSFPTQATLYCLAEAWIKLTDVDAIVYYEKPFIKFERLLETYLAEIPFGFQSFLHAIPVWIKEKLFLKTLLFRELSKVEDLWKEQIFSKLRFSEHHLSHCSSAFYPSPFEEAAILTIDWVWEWATTRLAHWKWNKVETVKEIQFPHSIWLLYSAFTYYLGFKVNSWEYKIMGLAPYGNPKYTDFIKKHLIDIKDDGSYKLNMKYFTYSSGLTMVWKKFEQLFDKKRRQPESTLTQDEMDIAASLQAVTEEVMVKLARHAKEVTWSDNLCLAWWVALNCVWNWKILEEKIFKNVWIQPASWDAWWALWAALAYYYEETKATRWKLWKWKLDRMKWSYLWPKYSDKETEEYLNKYKAVFKKFDNEENLTEFIAKALKDEKVVWLHHWRMEFWPRALWNRSIIWDARSPKMQLIMNLKIKFRESFRPFAPSVLFEKVNKYFELNEASPYMLLVAQVHKKLCKKMTKDEEKLFWIDKLNIAKSSIPAITHVDYSARVQTVHKETNPFYYKVIEQFEKLTGCAVVVNTSFNVRWEPIVNTPEDSYKCFMRTDMDILVVDNYVLEKEKQQEFDDKENWLEKFELD